MSKIKVYSLLIILIVDSSFYFGCSGSNNIFESKSIISKKESVAQNGKCTIMGKITDANSKEGIIGATFEIISSPFKTSTDPDGNYQVSDLISGEYSIRVRMIGYKQITISNFTIEPDQLIELNFKLGQDHIVE